ncbi:uncharacterized protein MONBRDRAFT_19310 [Monosiga brevicollis MX1]|uniref:Large ribosomal subunit protein mL43 n=1 Tax=Monosiga brevicollis TaxID=81824 RepID=A9UQM1_MONBE|nr:uncharacterized protein MONBRDRAFT_19310 [Monosiga brevicollis MX1]EDQ92623.1 predicted protein [Monosiga brevicollis MX1]|eukprot:XP_001742385.1 hypothetical protein [Monosiga brevicollis MX1]
MASTRFARFVPQLRLLRASYCKGGDSSKGMREYIQSVLPSVAEEAPWTVFRVEHNGGRHPYLEGHFLNGRTRKFCVKNMSTVEIDGLMSRLQAEEGFKAVKDSHWTKTRRPSIQGTWNAFLNSKQQ